MQVQIDMNGGGGEEEAAVIPELEAWVVNAPIELLDNFRYCADPELCPMVLAVLMGTHGKLGADGKLSQLCFELGHGYKKKHALCHILGYVLNFHLVVPVRRFPSYCGFVECRPFMRTALFNEWIAAIDTLRQAVHAKHEELTTKKRDINYSDRTIMQRFGTGVFPDNNQMLASWEGMLWTVNTQINDEFAVPNVRGHLIIFFKFLLFVFTTITLEFQQTVDFATLMFCVDWFHMICETITEDPIDNAQDIHDLNHIETAAEMQPLWFLLAKHCFFWLKFAHNNIENGWYSKQQHIVLGNKIFKMLCAIAKFMLSSQEDYYNPGRVFYSAAQQVWPSYEALIAAYKDFGHCEDIFAISSGIAISLRIDPPTYWERTEIIMDAFLHTFIVKGNWFFNHHRGVSSTSWLRMRETSVELETFMQQGVEFLMFIFILIDPSFCFYNQQNNVHEPNRHDRRLQYTDKVFNNLKSCSGQELMKFCRHLEFFKKSMSAYRQRTLHDQHKGLRTYVHKFDFSTFTPALDNLIFIIEHVIRA